MELHTEAGSRSHFWTPISQARQNSSGVRITAKKSWVTSAGHAQSYVDSSLAPEGSGLTDSTLYLIPAGTPGLSVTGLCDGLGLRANASAPPIESESRNPALSNPILRHSGFASLTFWARPGHRALSVSHRATKVLVF